MLQNCLCNIIHCFCFTYLNFFKWMQSILCLLFYFHLIWCNFCWLSGAVHCSRTSGIGRWALHQWLHCGVVQRAGRLSQTYKHCSRLIFEYIHHLFVCNIFCTQCVLGFMYFIYYPLPNYVPFLQPSEEFAIILTIRWIRCPTRPSVLLSKQPLCNLHADHGLPHTTGPVHYFLHLSWPADHAGRACLGHSYW